MTPTAFCQLVENRLGYAPPNLPAWKKHQAMARQVKMRIANDPELYTWRNLTAAVELLARERLTRNPLGVLAHVPRAVKLAQEAEVDIEIDVRAAIAAEQARGNPDGWVERLSRAVGQHRFAALEEYRAAS